MGLLDDLKKEAEKKEELARQQGSEQEAQRAFYTEHLRDLMLRAEKYFSELVEQLNAVSPDVGPDISLAPPGKPAPVLKQGSYLFKADDDDNPMSMVVRTECKLEKKYEYDVRGIAETNRFRTLLGEHKFPCHVRDQLDGNHDLIGGTFIMEGPLTVQIKLQASPEDRCIYIDLLNVDIQPQKRYKLPPEKVNDDLFDRLSRMLIREQSTLVEVKISDEAREELRRKVEEEKLRQAQEEAEARAYREAERLKEEEARLINRAKRSVTEGIKKILSRDEQD